MYYETWQGELIKCMALLLRSVLYQLKAFSNSFSMNPIQLPPKARICSVAASDSHFVVVNDGKWLTFKAKFHLQNKYIFVV